MSELTGKTIDQYQFVEIIGENDTAQIYKGFQPSMNRYVAVQVLKPDVAKDPAAVQQFTRQGELLAQMQYPNILPVYDSGQQEGLVYRVSRYAESGALQDHVSWFYNLSAAQGLIDGLTSGLEYIHGQGYVHGNLKPSNIYLDEQHQPLLTDFGFPQQLGAPPTPYMSPEQVRGGAVDRRADVYALGVLLYEVLVGEVPPVGAVVSPRAKRPDLSEAVEKVILKAMAQNPDQRFQTAGEFRAALGAALRPVAPTPQPQVQYQVPPAPAPAQAPAKKGTSWLAIVLGVLLLIVICVGAYLILPGLMGDQETAPEPPPVEETVAPPPTQPPQEPTQPPPEPTQPPVEQPPVEQPPTVQPPEGGGGILDQICGGAAGLGISSVVLSGVFALRKRKKKY